MKNEGKLEFYGKKFEEWRQEFGFSQQEFAKELGLSPGHYWRIENGEVTWLRNATRDRIGTEMARLLKMKERGELPRYGTFLREIGDMMLPKSQKEVVGGELLKILEGIDEQQRDVVIEILFDHARNIAMLFSKK